MVYHLIACLLCACVLALGIRTTSDLDWPFDPDHLRDISHAQTIRDGSWLQDPFYPDEWLWYNPLLPGTIAAASYLTGLPVNVVATRAGAYLNLAAPLTFYLLVLRLTGPPTALASLVGMLFLVHAPTWAAPGYSPWLFGSAAAQPFFYLTLTEYAAASTSGRRWRHAAAGFLLGLTFLTHTAPAILATATILSVTIVRAAIEKQTPREPAIVIALVAVPAVIVAVPFLVSIVGHYHLVVRNGLPLIWTDPKLPSDDWRPLLAMIGPRPLVNSLIAAGVIGLILGRARPLTALIVAAWTVFSVAFFAYNNYMVTHLRTFGLPAMVPAHHFLMYERAVEMVLFGLGLTWAARAAVSLLIRVAGRPSADSSDVWERRLAAVTMAGIVVHSYPALAARDSFGYERDAARLQFSTPELRSVIPWIRDHTVPSDVFLTAEGNCLSLVGPAGRKCVAPPRFFANPYVDWNVRDRQRRALWDALTRQDCDGFRELARATGVTHVMTVEGRTPRIRAGQCGVWETGFAAAGMRIYRGP